MASSAYGYCVRFNERSTPPIDTSHTDVNIPATGEGLTYTLLDEVTVPGGLLVDEDFVAEYAGFFYGHLSSGQATIDCTLVFRHIIGDTTFDSERKVKLYSRGSAPISLHFNDYNSRTRLFLGTYITQDGTSVTITEETLANPSVISLLLNIKAYNPAGTARKAASLTDIEFSQVAATYYQVGLPPPVYANSILDIVRQYGQVQADTEEFNGISYWSDGQLQAIIDGYREPRKIVVDKLNDNLYKIDIQNWYWVDVNTLDFQNSSGQSVDIDYTINHNDNSLIISSTTKPTQCFGMWINIYDVLAELWNIRASQRYDYVQMKAGSNTLRMQNEYEHCLSQRDYYKNQVVRSFKR